MRVPFSKKVLTFFLLLSLSHFFGLRIWAQDENSQVKPFIEAWLDSQNKGDFQKYQSFYATRFYGIKRSGEKTSTFDQKGWFADRQKMFQKKMMVEISGIKITPVGSSSVVQFKQVWQSGTYKDFGLKQLVLIQEKGNWKISREEMLNSHLASNKTTYQYPDPKKFVFTMMVDNREFAILSDEEPNEEWGKGEPKLLQRGSPWVAIQEIDFSKLPKDKAAWKTALLDLNHNGCVEHTIKDLFLLSAYQPHFGVVQEWEGTHPDIPPGTPKMTEQEIANAVWGGGSGEARHFVAELNPMVVEDCLQTYIKTFEISDKTTKQALDEFRKLKGYLTIQENYQKYATENHLVPQKYWDLANGENGAVRDIKKLSNTSLGRVFLAMNITVPGGACGEETFGAEFCAIWEVTEKDGNQSLLLLTDESGANCILPDEVIDYDNDRQVEFVNDVNGAQQLLEMGDFHYNDYHEYTYPDYDCGC